VFVQPARRLACQLHPSPPVWVNHSGIAVVPLQQPCRLVRLPDGLRAASFSGRAGCYRPRVGRDGVHGGFVDPFHVCHPFITCRVVRVERANFALAGRSLLCVSVWSRASLRKLDRQAPRFPRGAPGSAGRCARCFVLTAGTRGRPNSRASRPGLLEPGSSYFPKMLSCGASAPKRRGVSRNALQGHAC
jgi:hypothetical protein